MTINKLKSLLCVLLLAVTAAVPALPAMAALPPDMSWVKYSGNPVAPNGLCGLTSLFRPAIVVESPGNYTMYISAPADGTDLYAATSSDGGESWSCANGSAPVLERGSGGAWDDTRVTTAAVVKDGLGDYKMWYTGRNAAGDYALGYATSSDGLLWDKHLGNPVFSPGGVGAWDSQYVRAPAVVKVAGTYHMFYSGTDNWPRFHIGHATSPDGIVWTRDAANPVLSGTPGMWDQNEAYGPSVVMNGAVFELFYSGNNGNAWLTGHASSNNGTTWTKDANAILSPAGSGAEAGFDSTDYAAAVLDGSDWKLFYSAGGSYRVHLATLEDEAQLTYNQLSGSVAVGDPVVVTIDLTDVTDMFGYQFVVNYDASKVSATAAFVDTFFDTTSDTFIPGGWNADCAAGVCQFAVSKKAPGVAVSGSGTLAQITFTGVAAGDTTLTFTSDILSDVDGGALTHSVTTGWLTVFGTANITGTVSLQGRATPVSAGTVTLTDRFGYYGPVVVPYDSATGEFSADVPADASTEYNLVAEHFVYLNNKYGDSTSGGGLVVSSGGSFSAGSTTLRGGDANNDSIINILDMSCIGGDFGGVPFNCTSGSSSDINEDGTVNILDLVLAGGNFELTAPQTW